MQETKEKLQYLALRIAFRKPSDASCHRKVEQVWNCRCNSVVERTIRHLTILRESKDFGNALRLVCRRCEAHVCRDLRIRQIRCPLLEDDAALGRSVQNVASSIAQRLFNIAEVIDVECAEAASAWFIVEDKCSFWLASGLVGRPLDLGENKNATLGVRGHRCHDAYRVLGDEGCLFLAETRDRIFCRLP